jgi:radical SAM superfamily enzyme YgiQ (UPF0313 family)
MNKVKILLISANNFKVPYPVYPLGISYLKTYIESQRNDYDIKLFDVNIQTIENLVVVLNEYKPDFTGVSMRNVDDVNSLNRESFIEHYKNIVNTVKKNSKCVTIAGGSGFSIFPEKLYRELNTDYAIYGEGETALQQLIDALTHNQDISQIEGLLYTLNGVVKINPKKNYVHSLNLDFDSEYLDYYWKNSGMLNIQTKRGCPYNCIYCTYPLIEGTKVRMLNADKIVETLKELYFKKGIDYMFFTDSVFNINNDFNFELAEKIIQSGIKMKWGAYFTIKNLPEELLIVLKRAGLVHIEFGTESLSDSTLANYGKHFTVSDIVEKSELCNKLDIDFAHFLILGGYGETKLSIAETFENSKKINHSVFFPFVGMRIYPGTILQKYAIEEGLIQANDELLEPKYYISKDMDIDSLKIQARNTGRRWVFPDEDLSGVMLKMRAKNKKGPLWEYLIQ